ncbi:SdrD B-like domain-containing protein [Dyadobacter sp. BHUBP1]|uniref:SdrD B-like domain-containing protein n=1 Tax=Dyadobacter sp. BHUBP1 TaxID=3424178 RepID=UPI003D338A0A
MKDFTLDDCKGKLFVLAITFSVFSQIGNCQSINNTDQNNNIHLVSPIYRAGIGVDTLPGLVAVSMASGEQVSLASSAEIGAVWAVIYNFSTKQLYTSAFAKRHVGYGPLGTGGIYRTDWASRKTVPWLDLQELGIVTGGDHHQDLSASVDSVSKDARLMSDVGRVSLGGMDISEDGKDLFVMNLFNRTLYKIRLPSDSAVRPSKADVSTYPIPVVKNRTGEARPFAVKVFAGKVYIGVVYDAAYSQSVEDLLALVYVLDQSSGRFKEVFQLPLDYKRGKAVTGLNVESWYPWTDDFDKALHPDFPSTATRPQPILASLDFDDDGSVVLGLMDRFGHQAGTGHPSPSGKASYSAVAAGDILRAYPQIQGVNNRRYRLESNGAAGAIATEGRGNAQGPSGGEFYFQDGFIVKDARRVPRVVHEETGAGGVIILNESGEILVTCHEPTDMFNSGGIKALSNKDGRFSRGWELYPDGERGTFGKANGVGDVEVVRETSGIKIGGLAWFDENSNGLQDTGEVGLPGMEVQLWQENKNMGTTISDEDGVYSFTDANVEGGLNAYMDYTLRVKNASHNLEFTGFGSWRGPNNALGMQQNGYVLAALKTNHLGSKVSSLNFGYHMPATFESMDDAQFLVYPNPVSKNLIVNLRSTSDQAEVVIADLNGREVARQSSRSHNGLHLVVLRVAELAAGSYTATILAGGKAWSKVIVKY